MTYAEELKHLGTLDARNEFISNLLFHIPGNTLCLFQLVENQGQLLYDKVIDRDNGFFDDRRRKVFFIYGNTSTEEREKIRATVENEKNSITIAKYGTFSTGVNIRNINNIVSQVEMQNTTSVTINREDCRIKSEAFKHSVLILILLTT